MENRKIAVIGLGNMGSRILSQLQEKDYEAIGISRAHGSLEDVEMADTAIIAVKPQSFLELAAELKDRISRQLIISIMAGVALRTLSSELRTDRVVRTMPNLALATGNSVTAYYGKKEDTLSAQPFIELWGSAIELEAEGQFDAFTALAGSGPAYFYELARIKEEAAIRYGFTEAQARNIGIGTLKGAASVIGEDDSATEWVKKVTSKGGTTEAAFKVFTEQGFQNTVESAIDAATARSKELSEGNG